MGPRRRRWIALVALVLVAGWWLSGLAVVAGLARRPQPLRTEPLPATPSLELEVHRLTTPAGESFGAWWYPGGPGRAAVLLLHANGGTRASMVDRAVRLQRRGHPVLTPTLHAHGDATGAVNDYGLSARHQVPVCLELIERLAPGAAVVVDGLSLGAATALLAAPEVGRRVDGYVLEAPFVDLESATRSRLRLVLPSLLVEPAYLAMRAAAPLYLDPGQVSPLRAIERMPRDVPALFLCGGDDLRAPPEEVARLVAAHGRAARLVTFPGSAHEDLSWSDPPRFWSEVEALLRAAEARARR